MNMSARAGIDTASGDQLHRQHKEALIESRVHVAVLASFRESLQPEDLRTWEQQVITWERDPRNAVDPYCADSQGM